MVRLGQIEEHLVGMRPLANRVPHTCPATSRPLASRPPPPTRHTPTGQPPPPARHAPTHQPHARHAALTKHP